MYRTNLLESFILGGVTVTGRELGRGVFARAFEVKYRGASYAGKEIRSPFVNEIDPGKQNAFKDHVLNEYSLHSICDHSNIVKFIGIFYDERTTIPKMVMERMDSDLMGVAMRNKSLPLHKMLSLLHDVSLGVCYLHSHVPPLLHRDLTVVSILVNSNTTVAKISDLLFMTTLPIGKQDSRKDFWEYAYILKDHPDITLPPVFDYLPPEMFTGREEYCESIFADGSAYGLPVDIFCYGVVVLCAITGDWPKPIEVKDGAKVSRTSSEVERRRQYLDKMLGEVEVLRPLVEECLDDDPAMRPTIATVCERIKDIREKYRQQHH